MKYFITGATGFIGTQLCKHLASEGHTVHALYRAESKTTELNNVQGVMLFKGNIMDLNSLQPAMEGCDGVFHLAAFAKPWHKDSKTFYRLNVQGALNVFQTAKNTSVKRVVFTSTAGVISPSNGIPSDEKTNRSIAYSTHYDRSKADAEEKAIWFSENGLEVVTVNPSRVYGPGLLSDSNGVTKMIKMYLKGKFRLLPGNGQSIGNYVFIDDVIEGHIKAMQHGQSGERYILGGDNASFIEFFDLLSDITGKDVKMYKIPIWVMNMAAKFMELRASLTGKPPLITPPWVQKYLYNWETSSNKAIQELGYKPTKLEDGLAETVDWILKKKRRGIN